MGRYSPYVGLVLTLVGVLYVGKKYQEAREKQEALEQHLAKEAIALLKLQLRRSKQDERGRTLACIAAGHLRDELQPDVLDLQKRKRVWEGVTKIVEGDENVRAKQTDIRGEIMKVWEWVGPEF